MGAASHYLFFTLELFPAKINPLRPQFIKGWFNPVLVYYRFDVFEFTVRHPEQLEIRAFGILVDSLMEKAQEVSLPVAQPGGNCFLALF
jgi:hypothetical protein